ncbi:MAG TPA: RtcB family protein [Nitriliruptorales bacterium]|nr:RtcB family protein [Nitriliruptorales bacterium]
MQLSEETPYRWRIAPTGQMRVPGVVFSSRRLLPAVEEDESLQQVTNVATLPGIVGASFAMPDMHWGYGFPIGGVAATDIDEGGVVSPGGVGFDISCGVRLLTAPMTRDELGADDLERIMDRLDRSVPRGLGRGAVWQLGDEDQLVQILTRGSAYAVERGRGTDRDLERTEDGGFLEDADPTRVSSRALERGLEQVGSLGSGNHFLEVQYVDELFDAEVAAGFGLEQDQVCVMIHTGSRGLGHQVCQDHVRKMQQAMRAYGIDVPDRQLACAPVDSPQGAAYLQAMAAGANFGRANRQLLAEATRDAFGEVTGRRDLELLYDVSHNMAKVEEHRVDTRPEARGNGAVRRLCVHRKGSTLALPPDDPRLPQDLRPYGQPVLIPGSMGTGSYVLTGVSGNPAFDSTAHGAGRTMSRKQARSRQRGDDLHRELESRGILVREESERDLPEEAPYAYKDVDEVVRVCEQAGLSRRVARVRPLGVVKG